MISTLDLECRYQSIGGLCRVAAEVRIFPLAALGAGESRHLSPIPGRLAREGYAAGIETVPYEFKRGANQMLRIARRAD